MFLDKVTISIKAGNGGNGHASFFRDKANAWGGPDGGDGGRGGDVAFVGSTRDDNLVSFRFSKKFHALNGENGGKQRKKGKSGDTLVIEVPLGTRIYKIEDSKTREIREFVEGKNALDSTLLADLTEVGQTYTALKGGAGGLGNSHFATARKQTPNFSQTGEITKEYQVQLELHTIADIGLVGFPNVGKSTLLSVITRATPKIANYHFTTLHPNIGVWAGKGRNLVIADIPGLIEGASEGVGLGHEFLRHITRTKVLLHLVDIAQLEGRNAIDDFYTINRELERYSPDLARKPQIIALNKSEMADPATIKAFKKAIKADKTFKNCPVFEISAATRQGLDELMQEALRLVLELPEIEKSEVTAVLEAPVDKNHFEVHVHEQPDGPMFVVTGPLVDNLARGVILTDTESNYYFQRRLKDGGVIKELKKRGMQTGSLVSIGGVEFEWMD